MSSFSRCLVFAALVLGLALLAGAPPVQDSAAIEHTRPRADGGRADG